MNTSLKFNMTAFFMLLSVLTYAQIKNAKSETLKIYGNCDMCKTSIEKAGNVKNVSQVSWNKDSKMASLTYDPTKTNSGEILRRIALEGYDSDQYLAPDAAYHQLPSCCRYERQSKPAGKAKTAFASQHAAHAGQSQSNQQSGSLKAVFEHYFSLKDALVRSDGSAASAKAQSLQQAISAVKMDALATEEHLAWMKVVKSLTADAEHISGSKDLAHQRSRFAALSENMYVLMKASKQHTPVYYQRCPMFNDGKGATWLSRENTVKNPYYGSQMLGCGSIVETLN